MEIDFESFIQLYNSLPSGVERTGQLLEFAEESMQTCPAELFPIISEARESGIAGEFWVQAALCDRLLGWIAYDRGDFEEATGLFRRALESLAHDPDETVRLRVLNGVASVLLDQGEYESALTVYREALALAENLGDTSQTVILDINLGEVLYLLGQYNEAETLIKKALETGGLSRLNLSLALNQMSKIFVAQEKPEDARAAVSGALSLARDGGFSSALAMSLAQMGSIEVNDGHLAEAENLLLEARTIAGPIDRNTEALATISLGRLKLKMNNPKEAFPLFQSAVEISRKNGAVLNEADALHGLADSLAELGRHKEALEAFTSFHILSERIHKESVTRQISLLSADLARRETEILREQTRILTLLGDLGQNVTASLKLEDIILTLYQSIGALMKAETFGLSLYQSETRTLNFCLFIENGTLVAPFEMPLDADTFSSWCFRNRKDILINDVQSEFGKYLTTLPQTFGEDKKQPLSCLYVPLLAEGQVLGVLSAQSYTINSYTEQDRATLRTIAASVSVAVQNARLFKQVHQLATVDSLTGAATRRYLFERAEEEFQRFKRDNFPLAMVMIDLDHFKLFNDTWGHQAGDAALSAFGAFCLSRKRPHDLFGRYGGEEFVLILSGTTLEGARQSAERLCNQLGELVIRELGGQTLRITASFGVTSFDSRDEDLSRTFARADSALYEAKMAGRNRVAIKKREE